MNRKARVQTPLVSLSAFDKTEEEEKKKKLIIYS